MARGNLERRSNPAPRPLPPSASRQQPDASASGGGTDREDVLALWKNASEHMRRGTHAKALRILQKAVDKLGGLRSSPPILLHAYSTAQQLTAAITADRKIRARHFKSAIEASRQATEIAPESVALAHSYATLLLGASRDMDDDDAIVAFPSIIAECERGIQIKEPSDPALYDLVQRDSEHLTADVLAALHELKKLVSEDLEGMKRYKETKLKIVDFQKQQHAAASDSPPLITAHCADQRKDGLEQSYEVINDSGKCADRETSEEIQTQLDSDDFGCGFSITDARPSEQEEETQAEETGENQARKLNPKHFSEQSRSLQHLLNLKLFPSYSVDGAIPFPSEIVRIQDCDRRFLEDLRQSIVAAFNSNGEVVHGSGLKSDDDDKSCLLNVIIQSLWHLSGFREELLKTSSRHKHVGDPRAVSCVVCALCHIFTELSKVSKGEGEAVAPTYLRMALSISFPAEKLIRAGQMNDAYEVLEAILRRMHDSYTYGADCHAESHERNCTGSWDCANNDCIAHDMFGADVHERMICYICGLVSRQHKYTSFIHYINTCSLNCAMRICPGNPFDDILKAVMMVGHRACDPDAGGCGKPNHMSHTLSSSPHVFIVALGWQIGNGSVSDMLPHILAALGTEINIGVIYPGTSRRSKHFLVSMACFYSQRYICFAIDGEHWVLYDDQTAKVVGDWIQVLIMCEEKEMQPLLLFFEAAN